MWYHMLSQDQKKKYVVILGSLSTIFRENWPFYGPHVLDQYENPKPSTKRIPENTMYVSLYI